MKSLTVRVMFGAIMALAIAASIVWKASDTSSAAALQDVSTTRAALNRAIEKEAARTGKRKRSKVADAFRDYKSSVSAREAEIYGRLKELDILIADPPSASPVDDPALSPYLNLRPEVSGPVAEYDSLRAELSALNSELKFFTDKVDIILGVASASCPPLTTINGTLGSGSPDFPAASGQQTGRILNGLGNVTCGSSNPCTLNTATGLRAFDSYTFINPGATTACVTVNFTMTGCNLGQAMQFSARLGSFDPANPCANYVGDGGAGFSGEVDGSFSFNVPAGEIFVVVVNENDPGGAVGCAYSLTISGITCPILPCAITCPSNVTQPNDPGQCGAVVNFPAPATEGDCIAVTCNPASGSFFPVGATTVTCTATAGPSCSFTVTVNDTQSPSINCPAPIVKSNDAGQCSAIVNFTATATDNCPIGVPVCMPASGSSFPVGTTTVTCTVQDAAGNSKNCSFTVTVNDTQKPTITCPDDITAVGSVGQSTVVVNYTAPSVAAGTASDNCAVASVVCNPPSGSAFPLGTTTVTCTAADTSGNTAQCSFRVSVFDVCIEDDTNPDNEMVFISAGPNKGEYRICCGGVTLTGKGSIGKKKNVINLVHFTAERRVEAFLYKNQQRATAALQFPPSAFPCVIADSNTGNNNCSCSP
ncbi:MAG: HYR domain-containing protein [Blastocatellia bacterium]|nr:HYR domain-containing protein [Blastocatellia bacterium]